MHSVVLHLVLESLDTADTYTEDNAHAILVDTLSVNLTVGNSL